MKKIYHAVTRSIAAILRLGRRQTGVSAIGGDPVALFDGNRFLGWLK